MTHFAARSYTQIPQVWWFLFQKFLHSSALVSILEQAMYTPAKATWISHRLKFHQVCVACFFTNLKCRAAERGRRSTKAQDFLEGRCAGWSFTWSQNCVIWKTYLIFKFEKNKKTIKPNLSEDLFLVFILISWGNLAVWLKTTPFRFGSVLASGPGLFCPQMSG